jgi:dolichol-phosphate mannosyltransferase
MDSILFQKIARFLLSGGAVMAAYFAPYYLLTQFCGVWYLFSAIVASVTSSATNFILQKFWTFQKKSVANLRQEVIEFSLVSLGIAGANCGMLYVFVDKLHFNYLLAQVIVTGILCVASYFIIEWIFRDRRP